MTTLQIGKIIKKLLLSNEQLKSYIGDKVYPLIADTSTTYPFIIYRRSAIVNSSSKDDADESVNVEIYIVSERYDESISIAELVRSTLEHRKGKFEDLYIDDIIITDASESYEGDAFVQYLTITIITQK